MDCAVEPCRVSGKANVPCSKSYAQRSFAASLLCEGRSVVSNIEPCDDTRSALRTIVDLGAQVEFVDSTTCAIRGGLDPHTNSINIGESGLATRLFTPIAALCNRPITVSGRGSMLRRPIGMMIEPLQNLGVRVESDGFLPITVEGPIKGGMTDVDGYVSSQFITGLLIALPCALNDTVLHIDKLNSIPYIKMTLDTIEQFGVQIEHNDMREFYIRGSQSYRPVDIAIEGDWSGAAFMLVAGAIAGDVEVGNLSVLSRQADAAIVDVLSRAGAEVTTTADCVRVRRRNLNAFEFDATHSPDLFPILAVLAANCSGTTRIRGARRLIHKESNRAKAIVEQYSLIGINVSIDQDDDDVMIVEGGTINGGTVDSCNDHRIAMAAAVAGLTSRHGVTVANAEAVAKSYPTFWSELDKLIDKQNG